MDVSHCTPLDLALVGNCEVAALIDRQARVVWMCLPRPDGDPIFSALLTRPGGASDAGVFAVDLANLTTCEQRYRRNTAIVETILRDAHGAAIRIIDFCPRSRRRGQMFRPMMLVRIIERLEGQPRITLKLRPTAGYGASIPAPLCIGGSVCYDADGVAFRVSTNVPLAALTEKLAIQLDAPLAFILGPDEQITASPSELAASFLEETASYWQDWVRTLAVPFDWQDAVIRAAITLKLCTYEQTGAVLAAHTTSIPESPNSGRNWDYRYCWLRDSYFVVQALNRLGATRTMEGYLHFIDGIVGRSRVGDLQPLYTISGALQLEERQISTLEGYQGMGPVRVGNLAAQQQQNDVYGAVILAVSQLFFDQRLARPGGPQLLRQLEALGERAALIYERTDAGPWELRGSEHVHTFSAVMSWAGCDRLARITRHLCMSDKASRWQQCAESMRAKILTRAWSHRRRSFVDTLDGDNLDATLLLLPDLGLLPATDPRFLATLEAIGQRLRHGDLLFRYRHADDFGLPRSAFTVCAFWYVNALAAAGQVEEAREQFTRLLARRNSLGLLSEDIDPVSGEQWGNFPQTYSMVGIINTAIRLSRSWEEAL